MTQAAEAQAARIQRRLDRLYPTAAGYDIQVYVSGYSIVASVIRDENMATGYVGDRWPVKQAVEAFVSLIGELDRDSEGTPPRDAKGQPLDISRYQ